MINKKDGIDLETEGTAQDRNRRKALVDGICRRLKMVRKEGRKERTGREKKGREGEVGRKEGSERGARKEGRK